MLAAVTTAAGREPTGRFEVERDGKTAYLEYSMAGMCSD